jgi:hypothetical protein
MPALTQDKLEALLDMIDTLIADDTPWGEKKQRLLLACDSHSLYRRSLMEFVSWFEGNDT